MTRLAAIFAMTLLLCGAILNAEDPAKHLSVNQQGEAVWDLNEYLRGTTAQIRDRIYGETERLTSKTKQTEADLIGLRHQVDEGTARATAQCHKTAEYQRLASELQLAEAEKKDAHGAELLSAASRAARAREAIAKLENDAVQRATASDRAELTRTAGQLAQHQTALSKARAWRDNLIELTRNTFLLEAPMHPGEQGILGTVTVDRIIDAQTFAVRYTAIEVMGVKDGGEGTQTLQTHNHKTILVVNGIDSKNLKVGQPLALDRNFQVGSLLGPGPNDEPIFLIHPEPSEADKLLKAIVPATTEPVDPASEK